MRAVYDLRFETLKKIEGDTETLFDFDFRLIGRHRLLNGTITNHVDLDDTYEFYAHVDVFANGEWKPSNIVVHFKSCSFMKNIWEKYWAHFVKDSNMPRGKEACPFKKGQYYLRNVEVSSENWAQYARRGLNRAEIVVMKDNITYGGFVGTGTLTDRVT